MIQIEPPKSNRSEGDLFPSTRTVTGGPDPGLRRWRRSKPCRDEMETTGTEGVPVMLAYETSFAILLTRPSR